MLCVYKCEYPDGVHCEGEFVKAKYPKEHLDSIRERLLEYEMTLECGYNCFDDCNICTYKNTGIICKQCLLYKMGEGFGEGQLMFNCKTNHFYPWEEDYASNLKLSNVVLIRVQRRYNELTKYLIEQGFEFA